MAYLEDGIALPEQPGAAGRKNVLLIGDSIRQGYCATVREALADVANVRYPEENCRNTQYVLTALAGWATLSDPATVDVVHWNCGHWDVAHWGGSADSLTTPAEYWRNITAILTRLHRMFPRARLIFATTTPMNPDGSVGANPRTTAEIARYNALAADAARAAGVQINDLFAFARDWPSALYRDYCHYTDEGFRQLGLRVADVLREAL